MVLVVVKVNSMKRVRNAARCERRDRVNDNQKQKNEPDALLQLCWNWGNEGFYAVKHEPDYTR